MSLWEKDENFRASDKINIIKKTLICAVIVLSSLLPLHTFANTPEDTQIQVENAILGPSNPVIEEYGTSNILDLINSEFGTSSPMANIALCESGLRQYDSNGNVLQGVVDSQDIGVFQINEHYHLDEALNLGYNIFSPEGNIAFAYYLYMKSGTQPWSASKSCWLSTSTPLQ